MKKINLRGLSEVLSEKSLKNVLGGSGGGSEVTCFKCNNGYACFCPGGQDCLDIMSEMCPGGWIQWTSGVDGPKCD